VRVRVCVVFER